MKEWIRTIINPPGIDKKNRGSLFSAIGRIFGIVKNDAQKAFNAHFPYLADPQKLRVHGKSLQIPCLAYDTEDEYRARVATASFYLMRAGERGYCLEQLQEHFGDRYILGDEFLKVYVKIIDLEDEARAWVYSFLDEMLDPNIELTVAEWFRIVETVAITDSQETAAMRLDADVFGSGLCCDGRFYCDQGIDILCDGVWKCDGSWECEGFQPDRGALSDIILIETDCNGVYSCNGGLDCSGYAEIYSPMQIEGLPLYDQEEDRFEAAITMTPMEDSAVIDAFCDGGLVCDGRNLDSIIDAPMTLRIIRPFLCDGSKTLYTTTLDGAVVCDGSFLCAEDGWPCSDLIEEEEV
jgi:hypothetical protein